MSAMDLEERARGLISANPSGTLGAIILGFAFDMTLFGVFLNQFLTYWGSTSRERPFILVIVTYVSLCVTAESCYMIFHIWSYFVQGYGEYGQFLRVGNSRAITVFIIFTIVPVQIFYLERAYKLLNRSKWILIVVCPLLVISWGSAFGLMVRAYRIKLLAEIQGILPFFYVYDLSVVVADVIITGSIILTLRRSRTGWSHTDHLVTKLIRISFESQLPCTISALIILVNFAIQSGSLLNRFWTMWHAKVYAVSLLAVLNSRIALRGDHSFPIAAPPPTDSAQFEETQAGALSYLESDPGRDIQMNVNRHCALEDIGITSQKDHPVSDTVQSGSSSSSMGKDKV